MKNSCKDIFPIFKVGQKVKVVSKKNRHWVSQMDSSLGKVLPIMGMDDYYNLYILEPFKGNSVRSSYLYGQEDLIPAKLKIG